MLEKTKLKEKLDKIKREQEYFRDYKLNTAEETHAQINILNHEIEINYNPDWTEQIFDKSTERYLEKKNIPKEKALETLLTDLFLHEIGHRGTRKYNGCAGTFQKASELFIEPIQKAIKIQEKQKLQFLANAVEDLIDEITIKKTGNEGITPLTGTFLFDKEQGKKAEKENGKYDKFYEGLRRLAINLYGDKHDHALVRQYFSFDPELNKAVQNFLKRTGITDMKTTVYQGTKPVEVKDTARRRNYMMNEANWPTIATIFAEEFAKFLKDPPKQSLFGSGGKPEESKQDNGTGKKDSQDNGGEEQEGKQPESGNEEDGDKFYSGDGFGDELNNKKNQLALIKNGLKAGHGPGWMTNFEYLEGLYELLASDKTFELVPPKMNSKKYPLIDINERKFEIEEDSPRDVIGISFDSETKTLELIVGKHKYHINAKVKREVNNRPDFLFALLDTSSSMLLEMPKGPSLGDIVNPKAPAEQQWKYNSKYHIALIAYFMAVQRFDDLRISESDAYFANFSWETILSRGLKNSKKEALHPQFGGTRIQLSKIEKLLEKRNTLIFTVSDGEIDNDEALLEKVEQVAEYNPYFHIQIGDHSKYSKALKKKGLYVKQVKEEKELFEFIVDLTEKIYGPEGTKNETRTYTNN